MSKAPYDERNEADYRELTRKIRAGLEVLRKNPKIPATEKSLAKLSKCNRGTLRKRAWPLEGLRVIKRERKKAAQGDQEDTSSKQPTAEEIHLEDKKKLIEQLDMSRAENGRLFYELQEEQSKRKGLERVVEVLKAAKTALEQRVSELERECAKQKGARAQTKGIVVEFGSAARSSKPKGQKRKK